MRRLLILLVILVPLTAFGQVSMRDYPLNSSPTNNDTLLGIDEQQDPANWEPQNFTFPGIITYLNNQADYLRSATTFTIPDEVITATGSGRQTQRTPVRIDSSGNIVNVTGLELVPSPDPEWCFKDSSNPDSDKCVAYVGGNYVATGNGDLIFSAKIGNVKTEIGKFDSANTRWDFGNYALVVLTQAYGAAWNGNNEVPTKDAVYDKIETIAAGGEVNDLISQGTGEEIRISKVGPDINVKDVAGGNGVNVATVSNNIEVTGVNAAADNVTKGVAAFDPNDFNSAAGIIALDYTNGQKANISASGFLSRFATTAEIEAGTLNEQAIAPDQFAASHYAVENIGFNVVDNDQAAATGVLVASYSVPAYLQNHKFASMTCSVWDAGTGGSMTIQAIKRNSGANVNLLTAALTIAAQFFVTSTAVDAANASLDEGDILTIEILTIHTTTPANGVTCTMELIPDI